MYLPQDKPEKGDLSAKGDDIYKSYMSNCETRLGRASQWAKKQKLDVCPVRTEPDGSIYLDQTVYNWDVVLNI